MNISTFKTQIRAVGFAVLFWLVLFQTPLQAQQGGLLEGDDLLGMSLEDLIKMPVKVSGALTETTRRLNPSTVTTLTKVEIRQSGARDLDELLDIYIPNFQRMHDYYEFRKNGLRGINSDRDDKYMILVNGRIMNEHTHYGAISERDLPMLTDIHHIDVIRGPGSALYGPGAIAMVINIITETGLTYEGTEISARAGHIETFYSGEIKHGKKIDDESGYFLYLGISRYIGADEDKSPIEYGRPYSIPPIPQPRLHGAWRNQPKIKAHAQYTNGGFDAWVRFTKGGEKRAKMDWFWYYYGEDWRTQGDGYNQLTIASKYTQEISSEFSIDYTLSFDMHDYEKLVYNTLYSHREDEYTGRVMGKWTPNENHSLAFGGEMSYERFGKKSPGYPHENAYDWSFDVYGMDTPTWSTRMYSLLTEYQWKMLENWTVFLGGRLDNHTFTEEMYSPRGTLVYTPTDIDTAKLIYARSIRIGQAADTKLTDELTGKSTKPEHIDSLELRYERQQTDNLWFGFSGFYNYYDITSYNFSEGYTTPLGNLETWGAEAEATVKMEDTRVIFSHGFTKLLDWDPDPLSADSQVISSEHAGYGDDLANWSNHITKLFVHQELTDRLSVDSSVRAYWGYPGFKSYARWSEFENGPGVPRSQSSQFRPSFFTNLGFSYELCENCMVRLDGHDLLGFFDDDNNKRLYGHYMEGDTRSLPPSVSLSVYYTF